MYKRINEYLITSSFTIKVGETSNEIISEASNWEEITKPKTVWDLKVNDVYYHLDGTGHVSYCVWDNDGVDKERREHGTVFLTQEEGIEEKWHRKFETKMRKEFKSDEVDWNNTNHYRYFVTYDHDDKESSVWSSRYGQYQGAICCNDEETVKQFIKDNESDLLRYFGVVK